MHTDKIIELMSLSYFTGLDYATQMSKEEKENAYQNFKNNANILIELSKYNFYTGGKRNVSIKNFWEW